MVVLAILLIWSCVGFSLPKLISPEELKKNLGKDNLVILEFSNMQSYLMDGHIPGAVLTEKEEWRIFNEVNQALVRKPVKDYEKMLREKGISNDSHVVIYYKGNNLNEILGAVYAYWVFHLLGHEKVSILDGGWRAWVLKKYPVEYDEVEPEKGNFKAEYIGYKEVNWKYVYENIGKIPIIDGRPAGHYFGVSKFPSAKKYGHIPCSVPFPWEWWIRKDKKLDLLYIEFPYYADEFFKNLGIDKDDEVILFCFGGTGSAFLYFVMDVEGYKGMRVYDASKREWEYLDLPLVKYKWETFDQCLKK